MAKNTDTSTKKDNSAPEYSGGLHAKSHGNLMNAQTEYTTGKPHKHHDSLPFGRKNYMMLLIGIAILILGYGLLSVGEFKDASEFSVALYIAPIVILAGYVEIIFAIFAKNKPKT